MKCEEIMKRDVRTVSDTANAFTAASLMREYEIGFLPVCDAANRVVGVVTDRDLVLRVCADNEDVMTVVVQDIMARPVVSVRPTHTVASAERQMRVHRITRVVVVDAERRPVGILSLSDIAQYVRPSRVGNTLRVVAERKYVPERP